MLFTNTNGIEPHLECFSGDVRHICPQALPERVGPVFVSWQVRERDLGPVDPPPVQATKKRSDRIEEGELKWRATHGCGLSNTLKYLFA